MSETETFPAIVVKAIERCGGRAWVEDRMEGDHTQGAAFVVELIESKTE